MLRLLIPAVEQWDETKQEFVYTKPHSLQLEHSLVSISKWESKWHKPFLTKVEKTYEETMSYVRCMTLTQNIDPGVYQYLTNENMAQINAYIEDSMTATCFLEGKKGRSSGEQMTSELIYYWMVALNIPFECQKWHLNRLFALLRVCSVKNQTPKKRSKREIMSRNAHLNELRKKQLNTNG